MATLNLSKPLSISSTCRLPIPRLSPILLSRPWPRPQRSICLKSTSVRARLDGEARRGSGAGSEERETIMLPGCDYNHWLIVMEFPKGDNAPSREQMIDTYLDTLATVLGREDKKIEDELRKQLIMPIEVVNRMEEAKRNMYAFSTTTYTGFQCTVSEETSEKFKGLPGVLWVLPDSYIDVKNKDYGGDKYVDGKIIPCQYPVYQPKQSKSKYESKKYVRRRDGPAAADQRKPTQTTTPSESASG